jgi:hypothetical protein
MRLYELFENIESQTAKVSWKGNNGLAYNESVSAGLRFINDDDDIALEYPDREGCVMITGISVQHNGVHNAGRATDVIATITSWADIHKITLVLVPSSSGRLDNKSLISWYNRNGFISQPDGAMIRYPV